ncbi:membrane protein insertion efficiency factor YidD [Pimelobacter simplex]|uniref:membrane protein insertion efficiency factor YidD n=1 Tax=Nocardioides simplex TaxID=2045 RepID=UPI00214F65FF|nr:membrane protein insertion efficiency factor YidD [Pimelobacter simplex]UUW90940.1 membrane protein insertion efficiency factor YidD [Pimelobacter simplex]UUW94769.1 membrane protein insertion efficiency factor YidD [Pimelobacter simplex]
MKWLLIGLVRGYQLVVSPFLGPSCRYYPSCSAYAVEALRVHGAIKGTWLAIRRLLRCHPWAPGGVDHVPPRRSAGSSPELETEPDARTERASDFRPATVAGGHSQQGA